jgi:hypothetical protein
MKKLAIFAASLLALISLAACGNKEEDPNSTNEQGEQRSNQSELVTASEAFTNSKYKFWYSFGKSDIGKDDEPNGIYVSKDGKLASYSIYRTAFDGMTISEILDLSDKEKLTKLTTQPKEIDIDGVIRTATNSITLDDLLTKPTFNLITDKTGNSVESEHVYTKYLDNNLNDGTKEFEKTFNWVASETSISLDATGASAVIYDHTLRGFYGVNSKKEYNSMILTETGNDNVNFTLNSVDDKGKNITIDAD